MPEPLLLHELQDALRLAERSRRDHLLVAIEQELRSVSELAYFQHLCSRWRGRAQTEHTVSLTAGVRETATVLFLDLKDSTQYGRETDPEIIMTDFNHLMAHFDEVLKAHGASICGYRGDGFMALLRGCNHARRAVAAAWGLFTILRDFNQPREALGLAAFEVRVGIQSGEVCLGNVGTYDKMEFAAVGTTANLGARLQSNAVPGWPCIGQETYELVHRDFEFAPDNPRLIQPKGFDGDAIPVWDVIGLQNPGSSSRSSDSSRFGT